MEKHNINVNVIYFLEILNDTLSRRVEFLGNYHESMRGVKFVRDVVKLFEESIVYPYLSLFL